VGALFEGMFPSHMPPAPTIQTKTRAFGKCVSDFPLPPPLLLERSQEPGKPVDVSIRGMAAPSMPSFYDTLGMSVAGANSEFAFSNETDYYPSARLTV
jgi:hypothetical protein